MRTFIDQHNDVWTVDSIKELKRQIGASRAAKMYVDSKKGAIHIGYVIGELWLTEYTRVEK
jgi:hypothetical protein